MQTLFTRPFLLYVMRFLASFSFFYAGSLIIIGLSTPENMYSSFVANYLNFISPLRNSILTSAGLLLQIFSQKIERINELTIGIVGGGRVTMVYSCVGYGVMSFWAAFILVNRGKMIEKIFWLLGGWAVLWCLNVVRIFVLLLAIQETPNTNLKVDHHLIFNVICYVFIFGMIYFYDRFTKQHA